MLGSQQFLISFTQAEFCFNWYSQVTTSYIEKLNFLFFLPVLCHMYKHSASLLCTDLLELMSLYVYFLFFQS